MKNNFVIHRFVLKFFLTLIILGVIGVLIFVGLQVSGKKRLYDKAENKKPDLTEVEIFWDETDASGEEGGQKDQANISTPTIIVQEDSDNWEEGDVRYKGIHYRYNSEILTFLFLGVDKEGTVKQAANGIDGGQSDAIFLLVLNPKTKQASLISVHRDTMTEIDEYDKAGKFLGVVKAQITLQHGYGDGKEISCERTMKAVSKLFYGLPIHGYCAINMGAIPKINDAVGGVELVIKEDVADNGKILYRAGQTVKLKGNAATQFLRARDCDEFGSAGDRAERQKQYISAYATTALNAIKKDVTVLATLYKTISKYMVTDITVDEVSYFSTQAGDYHFGETSIYSLEGETVMGETFEEYYVNEKSLFELVLKVFYDTVDD